MTRIGAIAVVLAVTPSLPPPARPAAWAIAAVALFDVIAVELTRLVDDLAAFVRSVRDLVDASRERS